MPKGRGRGSGGGHKGQRRHFTNPHQLAESEEKKEKERQWRQQRGEISSEEDSEEEKGSSSSEEESESETEEQKEVKAKGVQHLIDIENPNRVIQKERKVQDIKLDTENTTQLSRREREELEKQKAKVHYQKLHAAGKTNEAKADLARLAIIKKQREEAAKKREEEMKAKKEADEAKANLTKKALGKKT